jgi:hypothetical protein
MTAQTRSPGDIVEARCTRCRTLTNHTIIALVETRIARVQCNTCGGTHNYHPPAAAPVRPARKTPVARSAPRTSARVSSDQQIWQQACSEVEAASAVPYAMDRSFQIGMLVAHPAFGVGTVTALFPPNKVEILFQVGRKLLRCAN